VLFTNGKLVPNLEMGHIEMKGSDAELLISDVTRKKEKLSWEEWAGRFNEYLQAMEKLIWPDLIILGGGASRKGEKFLEFLHVSAPVVAAHLFNDAGLTGAALAARYMHKIKKDQ